MACTINNFIVDRITRVVGFDNSDNVLFAINQATDLSINVASETAEAVDQLGSPIVVFNRSKTCEVSMNNAIFDMDLLAVQAGMEGGKQQAATGVGVIEVPMFEEIIFAEGTTSYTLAKTPIDAAAVKLYKLNGDGTFGTSYTMDTDASDTAFALSETTLSAPTGLVNKDRLMVVYTYNADGTDGNGAVTVINSAKNFPKVCKLVIECLGVEACAPEEMIFMYIIFPSFKPSADMDWTVSTDGQHPFNGTAQQDYCDPDKVLYKVVIPC